MKYDRNTTHTHTHKIKVNSLDEIIIEVKKHLGKESKWWVESFYMEDFAKQGVILKNDDRQTVEIWTENFEANGKNVYEIATNNVNKLATLLDLSPKNLEPNQKKKPEKKETETEKTIIYTFQGCRNFEELKEKIKKFYQEHQKEIKNSEFANWAEISEKCFLIKDNSDKRFYIFLGKKAKPKNEFNRARLMAVKIFGETFLHWDLGLIIYSIEKENNENLKKELESYWNNLISDKQINLSTNQHKTNLVREQQESKKSNKGNDNKLLISLFFGVFLIILTAITTYLYFRKKKEN